MVSKMMANVAQLAVNDDLSGNNNFAMSQAVTAIANSLQKESADEDKVSILCH